MDQLWADPKSLSATPGRVAIPLDDHRTKRPNRLGVLADMILAPTSGLQGTKDSQHIALAQLHCSCPYIQAFARWFRVGNA